MRIMIVTELFLPASDGLVLRLTEAIRYFHREGHRVRIVASTSMTKRPSMGSQIKNFRLAKNSCGHRH